VNRGERPTIDSGKLLIAKIKADYPMNYQQLTEGQLYQISALFSENYPIAKIAHKLGVHRSTIYRELKRNKSDSEYCPDNAHRKSLARKIKAQKRRLPALTEALVLFGLERDWSPQQISATGHLVKCPVSHEWIYQYIMRDKAQGGKLFEHLRQGHKKYRRGKNGKRETIKNAVSIDERPNEVDTKERFGDWEADTVMGKRGT
jgi:IS30 family transposase